MATVMQEVVTAPGPERGRVSSPAVPWVAPMTQKSGSSSPWASPRNPPESWAWAPGEARRSLSMLRRLSILLAAGSLVLAIGGATAFAGDKAGSVNVTSSSTCDETTLLQDNHFS